MKVHSAALVLVTMLFSQGPAAGGSQPAIVDLAAQSAVPVEVTVPGDYVIGPDDVIGVVFWKDQALSVDAVVRPDGKITLPLGREIAVAGLTPDQCREAIVQEAKRFVENPMVNIIVRQINSRKIFITGQVERPGSYPLTNQTTVMQLIALAGGLKEYAKAREIVVLRGNTAYAFNYEEILKRRRLEQNIALRPGDQVVVP